MESILKADIFFFITSISVVVVSCFAIVALFYFIKMLINFHKISIILRNYAEDADNELRDLGEHIRESRLFTFIFGKKKRKQEAEEKRSNKKTI